MQRWQIIIDWRRLGRLVALVALGPVASPLALRHAADDRRRALSMLGYTRAYRAGSPRGVRGLRILSFARTVSCSLDGQSCSSGGVRKSWRLAGERGLLTSFGHPAFL